MNFFNKCVSLALSIASRGFVNNKIDIPTKKLRAISCFGVNEIEPCPHLIKSAEYDSHHCGACGCGDHFYTQLTVNGLKYSKLDYPRLKCPLEMPGFSNYTPASPKEVNENSRKARIELYDILKLDELQVSNPTPSPTEVEIFDKLSKIALTPESK